MLLRLSILLLTLLPATAHADAQSRGVLEHVEVELVAGHESVKPGSESFIGLLFKLDPGWHVYWKNPGDSGEPPSVKWTLPEGVTVGEIRWPAPRRIVMGTIVTFGYEDEVLLSAPLKVARNFRGKSVRVRASATWLVCEKACIGQDAELEVSVPVRRGSMARTSAAHAPSLKELPMTPKAKIIFAERAGDTVRLSVSTSGLDLPTNPRWTFFADTDILDTAASQPTSGGGGSVKIDLSISDERTASTLRLTGILVAEGGAERRAIAIDTLIRTVPGKGFTSKRELDEKSDELGWKFLKLLLIIAAVFWGLPALRNWLESRGFEESA